MQTENVFIKNSGDAVYSFWHQRTDYHKRQQLCGEAQRKTVKILHRSEAGIVGRTAIREF